MRLQGVIRSIIRASPEGTKDVDTMILVVGRNGVRVVVGLFLTAILCLYVPEWMQVHREERAAKRVESFEGFVYWYYRYPDIPCISDRFDIRAVHMVNLGVTSEESRRRVFEQWVDPARIDDAAIECLKEVRFLKYVDVNGCHITDCGLAHLQVLSHLVKLNFTDTRTTPEGRAMLRRALPNCEIKPDP